MSITLEKANQILNEKKTKIIPGNIRKGIQIFDILGTYEGGSSDGLVKQFSTEESMNASTDSVDGDIALVYSYSSLPINTNMTDVNIQLKKSVSLSTAITATSTLSAVKVEIGTTSDGRKITLELIKTKCTVKDDSITLGKTLATYTSADGLNYVLDYDIDPLSMRTITCSDEEYGSFFHVEELYFGGLYKYNNLEWEPLNTGLSDISADLIYENVTVYGRNGVFIGDGNVQNKQSPEGLLRILHGDVDITTETYDSYTTSRLSDKNVSLYTAQNKYIKSTNIMPIKFATKDDGKALLDVCGYYVRFPDNSDYYDICTADGKYGLKRQPSSMNIKMTDGTIITLPGDGLCGGNVLGYVSVIDKDNNVYILSKENTTGYMTKINLVTNEYKTLSFTLSGTKSVSSNCDYIYDKNNNRILSCITTYTDSTMYIDIISVDTDFTAVSVKNIKSVSYGTYAKAARLAIGSDGRLVLDVPTATRYQIILMILNMNTLSIEKEITYTEGTYSLLESTDASGILYNSLIVYLTNNYAYTYRGKLSLSDGTYTETADATDIPENIPRYYDVLNDVVYSGICEGVQMDENDQFSTLYTIVSFNPTVGIPTESDVIYRNTSILAKYNFRDVAYYTTIYPYFNGTTLSRQDASDALHQVGWWKPGVITDYDALLIPVTISSHVEKIKSATMYDCLTLEYMIVYNPSKTTLTEDSWLDATLDTDYGDDDNLFE